MESDLAASMNKVPMICGCFFVVVVVFPLILSSGIFNLVEQSGFRFFLHAG